MVLANKQTLVSRTVWFVGNELLTSNNSPHSSRTLQNRKIESDNMPYYFCDKLCIDFKETT